MRIGNIKNRGTLYNFLLSSQLSRRVHLACIAVRKTLREREEESERETRERNKREKRKPLLTIAPPFPFPPLILPPKSLLYFFSSSCDHSFLSSGARFCFCDQPQISDLFLFPIRIWIPSCVSLSGCVSFRPKFRFLHSGKV